MVRLGPKAFVVALFAAFALLFVARPARAEYEPPPIRGHVNDKAGKLTRAQIDALNLKLDGVNRRTGSEIAVFLPASLEGNSIEDVAYYTFKAWKLGKADQDNGVLLVVAPAERKIYITTGRGVGDRLTDLQSKEISRKIGRHLKENQFYAGIDEGTTLIAAALGDDATQAPDAQRRDRQTHGGRGPSSVGLIVAVVAIVLVLVVVARLRRRSGCYDDGGGPPFIFFGGGGSGFDGGGFDGGGGGDFSGGGGDTGGGGAGDDY
jgi:uncharacterized protein